jgi:hypothetical protein
VSKFLLDRRFEGSQGWSIHLFRWIWGFCHVSKFAVMWERS